ncbi:MAG: hypothetical protein M1823_000817 [Watsoniomyces obsoletus]|nr:MAG: hypothetical protein M1823_000817 [Watsoniomyces obsoletus]
MSDPCICVPPSRFATKPAARPTTAAELKPKTYRQRFIDFIDENPTVFEAVAHYAKRLTNHGFQELKEQSAWENDLREGGKYFVQRNGSSLIAFTVGEDYEAGNGAAIIAGHVDALTTRLKPVSKLEPKAGYMQLGVAPYAGALNSTWWDRDLGIGGRFLIRNSKTGKVRTELLHLGWPIARIPTLAPHFGKASVGPFNPETQMVPVIGLVNPDWRKSCSMGEDTQKIFDSKRKPGSFTYTQPEELVQIMEEYLEIEEDPDQEIINWELELFDFQPATVGGLHQDFIFAPRIDDKLCSFAALEALLASCEPGCRVHDPKPVPGSIIRVAAVFDDEEIGSFLRQGARSNFLSTVLDRTCESLAELSGVRYGPGLQAQMNAKSFLISADVTHAVNPNFLDAYLENHAPKLNVGVTIAADPNGHMTTDAVSTALLQRIAQKSDSQLQVFHIRNDSRSGGTVGPMLSSRTGIRAIDAGLPQLSMHSIRAMTGSMDPGLGVKLFWGFFEHYEEVNAEFMDV